MIEREREKSEKRSLYISRVLAIVGFLLIVLAIVGFLTLPLVVCSIRIGNICLSESYPSLALGFWLILPGISFLVVGIRVIGEEKKRHK